MSRELERVREEFLSPAQPLASVIIRLDSGARDENSRFSTAHVPEGRSTRRADGEAQLRIPRDGAGLDLLEI